MNNQVLFIQGGGEGGYETDTLLASSLQEALGKDYAVTYPRIYPNERAADFGWLEQIRQQIAAVGDNCIIVAHSFGASMLLKYLSENQSGGNILGIFLIATPFWHGDEAWKDSLKLQEDFANKLPKQVPIYFYHCRDDQEVSFSNFNLYRQKLSGANFREISEGGHQLNNDLSIVAKDVKSL